MNFAMYSIRIFDLENEGQRHRRFERKMAGERVLPTCKCVQKLALVGPAVCSPYITVHFVTYERSDVLPSSITPFYLRWNGVKSEEIKSENFQFCVIE